MSADFVNDRSVLEVVVSSLPQADKTKAIDVDDNAAEVFLFSLNFFVRTACTDIFVFSNFTVGNSDADI